MFFLTQAETRILDGGKLSTHFLGKCLLFFILSSVDEPLSLSLLTWVILTGIFDFCCTEGSWSLLFPLFARPPGHEAIAVFTAIFRLRETKTFLNQMTFLFSFAFVLRLCLFQKFFPKCLRKPRKFTAPNFDTTDRAKWLLFLNVHGNTFRHKQYSENVSCSNARATLAYGRLISWNIFNMHIKASLPNKNVFSFLLWNKPQVYKRSFKKKQIQNKNKTQSLDFTSSLRLNSSPVQRKDENYAVFKIQGKELAKWPKQLNRFTGVVLIGYLPVPALTNTAFPKSKQTRKHASCSRIWCSR